ncbi:hypothetical protein C8Q76DRAFT_758730 [Earliella scabrosa]|nr:hypothetical protein C8Q76DRAFT_758730 [Earliella scabrosa]
MSIPTSTTLPLPLTLPPAIQAQLDASVNLLVIWTFFPALLVPIAVALFLFSNPPLRKKPVFICNVLAVLLGLAYGGVGIYTQSHAVSGRPPASDLTTALTCMYFFIPICVQCILLVRIIAVYPPRTLTVAGWVVIYGTLIVVTIARFVNIALALNIIVDSAHQSSSALVTGQIVWNMPYTKVEWFLQLFYDVFASALFLFRLRSSGALGSDRDRASRSVNTGGQRSSYTARLRALFWIAVSNFVLPVIFNVAQLVLIFCDDDIVHGVYVLEVSVYVEIIGVLLATLWCSGTYWDGAVVGPKAKPLSLEGGRTTESFESVKFAEGPEV